MNACAEILELQHISGLKYVIVIQFILYIYVYILFLWRNPLKSLKGLGHWSC